MNIVINSVIIFTFGLSVFSIFYLIFQVKKRKRSIVKSLLYIIISLNSIWYSVLILQFWKSGDIILYDYGFNLGLEVLFSSLLFLTRFLFLAAFFQMLIKILNYKFSKSSIRALKISVVIVFIIWILGWLEYLLFHTNGIADNFLIYSDILIFFSIILASFYLISQTKFIHDKPSRESIKLLGIIFIIPIALGFFKWLISQSISFENNMIERLSLHTLVILFNGLVIWWVAFYSNKISKNELLTLERVNPNIDELKSKYNISKREMEVIQLVCDGLSNKDIAEKLFISIDTVKDHNSRIFQKTDIKNRTQLAKLFLK